MQFKYKFTIYFIIILVMNNCMPYIALKKTLLIYGSRSIKIHEKTINKLISGESYFPFEELFISEYIIQKPHYEIIIRIPANSNDLFIEFILNGIESSLLTLEHPNIKSTIPNTYLLSLNSNHGEIKINILDKSRAIIGSETFSYKVKNLGILCGLDAI